MIQFTRTEIKWLIDILQDRIDENNEFMTNMSENALSRLLKQQNENLLSIKRRLQATEKDKMIKRIAIEG